MRAPSLLSAVIIGALALAPSAASSQQRAQCWDIEPGTGKTFLNMVMTDRLRDVSANEDKEVMASFAGTWVGDTVYPDGSMTDRTWYVFDPNGLFQYQSQTCGNMGGPCSQGYGTGEWTARSLPNRQIEVMFNFDDLQRSRACGSLVGAVQGNTMVANGSFTLQRVK